MITYVYLVQKMINEYALINIIQSKCLIVFD